MSLLVMLVVGLIAGWLAARVMGEGYGLVGDMVLGVVGAFVGGWLLRQLGVRLPVGDLGGTILVAFLGAVVVLLSLRAIRRLRTT